MSLRILVHSILVTACTAIPAWGLEIAPFQVRNLSPTALVHGLPIAETPYLLLTAGLVPDGVRWTGYLSKYRSIVIVHSMTVT
jgi:hypothetical protein